MTNPIRWFLSQWLLWVFEADHEFDGGPPTVDTARPRVCVLPPSVHTGRRQAVILPEPWPGLSRKSGSPGRSL